MKNNKNNKKAVLLGLVLGILFTFPATIGYLYAEGYINWRGTQEFRNSDSNLDKFVPIFKEVKEENKVLMEENGLLKENASEHAEEIAYLDNYVEQLTNAFNEQQEIIAGRDAAIKELQEAILQRDEIIKELQSMIGADEAQHEQAYKDIVHLDSKIEKVLKELQEMN